MSNYKTPNVITIPNPTGLDLALKQIQDKLIYITWLQYAFGRAWVMNDFEGNGTRRVTTADGVKPKIFVGALGNKKDGNYIDALPNDNWESYSFFVAEGPETVSNGPENGGWFYSGRNTFLRPMSLIVWLRLNKVDNTKDYIFLEETKQDVYDKLKLIPKLQVTGYTDETAEVWQGFDWTNNENKNLRYPNMGFRIFFNLSYSEPC